MFNRPTFMAILAVGLLISTVTLVYYIFSLQSEELYPSSANGRRPKARYNDSSIDINPFPTIVHHTWKTGSDPPAETVRWRKGCIALNPSYEFRMYDDDDLMKFTADHYPRYLPMLKKLKGVYMADMARVLVTYHYGGIYLDLDFYCHRPFRCLLKQVLNQLPIGSKLPKDVLVVSLEPLAHATLFRRKRRVVIQDFFLATPRHPFFLWLLEDRLSLFHLDGSSNDTDSSGLSASFPKGPFSYAIEKDIDRYFVYKQNLKSGNIESVVKHQQQANSTLESSSKDYNDDIIIELKEDVTHPMIDATNSRLQSTCKELTEAKLTKPSTVSVTRASDGVNSSVNIVSEESLLAIDQRASCKIVEKGKYFRPTDHTILVHMWTHVYLGWSFLRGLYNAASYHYIEHALPPTFSCYSE